MATVTIIFNTNGGTPIGGYKIRYKIAGSLDPYTYYPTTFYSSPAILNLPESPTGYEGIVAPQCTINETGGGQYWESVPPTTTTSTSTTTSTTINPLVQIKTRVRTTAAAGKMRLWTEKTAGSAILTRTSIPLTTGDPKITAINWDPGSSPGSYGIANPGTGTITRQDIVLQISPIITETAIYAKHIKIFGDGIELADYQNVPATVNHSFSSSYMSTVNLIEIYQYWILAFNKSDYPA